MSSATSVFDADAYAARVASTGCFICAFLGGDPKFAHEVVYEDDEHVVFLNRYPTTRGQLLVAPRRHVEHFARDLDADAWGRLQTVVHRAARALETVVDSERTYELSLGSQQRNRHLHVHVAALSPGVPLHRQQHAALMAENGVLEVEPQETAAIAAALRAAFVAGDPLAGSRAER